MWRLWIGLFGLPLLFVEIAFIHDQRFTTWTLFNTLAYPALTFVSLAVHELGHAVMARALGLSVLRLQIGIGRRIATWKLGSTSIIVNTFPVLGVTALGAERLDTIKRRLWLTTLAGPLATFAVLSVVWWQQQGAPFGELLWPETAFVSRPALVEMLAFQNALLLVVNLLPLRWSEVGLSSDGLELCRIPWRSDALLQVLLTARPLSEVGACLESGDIDGAQDAVEQARKLSPEAWQLRDLDALLLMERGYFREARDAYVALLSTDYPFPGARLVLMNNIAWANFRLRDESLRAEADDYSSKVLKQYPRSDFVLGTRGAILGWCGAHEDAIVHLQEAYQRSSSKRDRARRACCMAISFSALGQARSARRWLKRARANAPACELLPDAVQAVADLAITEQQPSTF